MDTSNHAKSGKWFVKNMPWVIAVAIITTFFLTAGRLTDVTNKVFLKLTEPENDSSVPSTTSSSFNYSFTIKDLENRKIPFEQFKGQVIFINLWATWCGPCRAEMPTIEALYKKVQNNDIQFVMLSLDEDKDQIKVRGYIEKNNYTFPTYMPSGNLPSQLQVPSIPTTFIVDKQGNIVRKITGRTNFNTDQYVQLLKKLAEK